MKEILCLTTCPPRECGIATFSNDLIQAIHTKFGKSFSIKICALESPTEQYDYPENVKFTFNTSVEDDYNRIANAINTDENISLVLIQHEFGLFAQHENDFLDFVSAISKPIIISFHTVLSNPTIEQRHYLQKLILACSAVIVMTQSSAKILQDDYQIAQNKINIIPHGTHLVAHSDKKTLKEKYQLSGRRVLTTFGLLSPGKSIETTLDALTEIIKVEPKVLFLIIGKTHPSILKREGEAYRNMLQNKVKKLKLTDHVRFVNQYSELSVLLEYLQLTDIYLFTSSDPNQAVSGTFVYALSCGCPIIATPIPHALEILKNNSGLIFDFKDSTQLAKATIKLLGNEKLRHQMRITGLQKMAVTAWENSAIAHVILFNENIEKKEDLIYSLPPINTDHIKRMSRHFAMIQFAKGNRPDIKTGYTLDDNARALMALSQVYAETKDKSCAKFIKIYVNFIHHCLQTDGSFLNYVDKEMHFTTQNHEVLLEDSNGRAVMGLGYFISFAGQFPETWTAEAIEVLKKTFPMLRKMQSHRSIAFALKGLCSSYKILQIPEIKELIVLLADKLKDYFNDKNNGNWCWFEDSLTYDNAVLPESMLNAYLAVGNEEYKEIAKQSFDFLLTKIFTKEQITVISNQGWLLKEKTQRRFGEQPVDVAGTVITLKLFYQVFKDEDYLLKQIIAFNWFLGKNHLRQIIYNPATGGCYDGLEEENINLNQGAESTVSYLMARLTVSY